MDLNKLDKLKEIDYEINPCCGLCIHGKFRMETDWGTCDAHNYEHLKHERECELSINKFGFCKMFEINIMKQYGMKSWTLFIKKKKENKTEDDVDFVEYMKSIE